ncbi:hypothetical protein VNO77_25316 [Canavalia gladiata]|uniref:Uncharacterized protein n=1 Tax=Canavalia gladiata TaxID=3824 RepID=A0AAN9LAE2_CANGL
MCINTFNAIGGGICVLVHSYIYGSKLSPFSTLEPGAVVGLTATVNPIKWLQFVQIKYSPMAFSAAIRIASQGCYAETSIREKANYALPIRWPVITPRAHHNLPEHITTWFHFLELKNSLSRVLSKRLEILGRSNLVQIPSTAKYQFKRQPKTTTKP